MQLYLSSEWSKIPWSKSIEGQRIRAFLEPMLKEGVQGWISNVETALYILHIGEVFLPVTVNSAEYANSYVASIYSLLLYAEEEMIRHNQTIMRFVLSPFLFAVKGLLKVCKINAIVAVNNFLLSTNLYDSLSHKQTEEITFFLQKRFPKHALIFRSINEYSEKGLSESLISLGFRRITSRSVYFFSPERYSELPSKKRWIIEKDRKLAFAEGITCREHDDFTIHDAARIKELYDLLYLKKYSQYNPAFTKRFFENVILTRTCTLKGVLYKNQLVGVIGYFKQNGVMATPIVGYDTSLPESLGLYRLLTARVLDEAISSGTCFHMSAGVGHFKRQRGAFQVLESMAVLVNHLPFYRRALWNTLAFLFNNVAAPHIKKYKL